MKLSRDFPLNDNKPKCKKIPTAMMALLHHRNKLKAIAQLQMIYTGSAFAKGARCIPPTCLIVSAIAHDAKPELVVVLIEFPPPSLWHPSLQDRLLSPRRLAMCIYIYTMKHDYIVVSIY